MISDRNTAVLDEEIEDENDLLYPEDEIYDDDEEYEREYCD